MRKIKVIDSHTGGEPTRLVISGFPDLGTGDMASRLAKLRDNADEYRATTMLEPRGNDVLVGALLCEPVNPAASAGVVYFNNAGYLGMCGHGTIGVVVSLAYMGRIKPGVHTIETPVGDVQAVLHEDNTVTVRNVPAYRLATGVTVEVPGHGPVVGDVAWGGNWFFLVASSSHKQDISPNNIDVLTDFAWSIRKGLEAAGITGAAGAVIDHIELLTDDEFANARGFVLCPGKAYDRSPCGTGTSAKLACLAADGKLKPGELWRQKSVIGSLFEAYYDEASEEGKVLPRIKGSAHVMSEATLLMDEADPFAWGIRL